MVYNEEEVIASGRRGDPFGSWVRDGVQVESVKWFIRWGYTLFRSGSHFMTGYGTCDAFVDDIRLGNNISPYTMITSSEEAIDGAWAKAVM